MESNISEANLFSTEELCAATGISLSRLSRIVSSKHESAVELDNMRSSKVKNHGLSGSTVGVVAGENAFGSRINKSDALESTADRIITTRDPEAEQLATSIRSPCGASKRKRNKEGWKSEQERIKRMFGMEYLGSETIKTPTGNKRTRTKEKAARSMGDPCTSNYCTRSRLRSCSTFPETTRMQIFLEFWSVMDWTAWKSFVRSLVDQSVPKQVRKHIESHRDVSFAYHLKLLGVRKPVCKTMFLSTLGLTEKELRGWLSQKSTGVITEASVTRQHKENEKIQIAKEYLKQLPQLPLHYCRAGTQKLYLEPVFTSKADILRVYSNWCNEKKMPALGRTSFFQCVKELNIGIYQSKKDQCDTCTSYSTGNLDENCFKQHRQKVEMARNEKLMDKTDALAGKCHVIAMDVQGVLLSPLLMASSMYYKTKLAVHNFTIYDLATRQTTCYLWDETEGELVASVFATCLLDYLEKFTDKLPIIVYSDGCTYQNRNAILSNALLYTAKQNKVEITQRFLEKGHTQMEVDSVHATIERSLKGKQIYVPTDYIEICMSARMNPSPYEVKYMDHSSFKDFSSSKHQVYSSIRPGKGSGDELVTDLRQIQYLPDGKLRWKTSHSSTNWSELPRKPKKIAKVKYPSLYQRKIPITERKYQDLMDMLPVIPEKFHDFYRSLPH